MHGGVFQFLLVFTFPFFTPVNPPYIRIHSFGFGEKVRPQTIAMMSKQQLHKHC